VIEENPDLERKRQNFLKSQQKREGQKEVRVALWESLQKRVGEDDKPEWDLDPESLEITDALGSGAQGSVYKGSLHVKDARKRK